MFVAQRYDPDEIDEDIQLEPILDAEQKFSPKALAIFTEWFDCYSNYDDLMSKDSCGIFIRGVTSEPPKINDDRVNNLFNSYDKNKDGFIEREEFMEFYRSASTGRDGTVRENLRHHNIRNDLKKLIDVEETMDYSAEEMPRYRLSSSLDNFNKIMDLLSRKDDASQSAWDLI
jgi:hypothetical protein